MSESRTAILDTLKSSPARTFGDAPDYSVVSGAEQTVRQKIDAFRAVIEAVGGEVHEVPAGDWVQHLTVLLQSEGLATLAFGPNSPVGTQLKAALPDGDNRLVPYDENAETFKERLFQVDAGITGTRGAIARTGSLILWPSDVEPRMLSLVPPVHFAVLDSSKLFGTFHDAVSKEGWTGGMPTNALLISGPSKTADIEQTLAYGVHGPKRLIVLILMEE